MLDSDSYKCYHAHKMSNQITIKKLNRELQDVKRELRLLRSLAISVAGKDPEGTYRPEFVRDILRASEEPAEYTFKSKAAFLRDLERA